MAKLNFHQLWDAAEENPMNKILENLRKAVIECDTLAAESWAIKALSKGIDPDRAFAALTEGIKQVGDDFGRGECYLPELIGASSAMTSAAAIIEEKIKQTGSKRHTLGTIVIGTVYGDIHSIGKSMVSSLAQGNGFEVIDLGVDVPAEKFVETVLTREPDILALSALLTTTAYVQKEITQTITRAGIRDKVKIVVGGAAVTQEFAEMIGADGYEPTAIGAVRLFKKLVDVRLGRQ